jgi:glycine oxidase
MAWQREYGAEAELVEGERLRRLEPLLSDGAAAALYCPGESHVHAPRLVAALEAACRKLGVRLLGGAGPIAPPDLCTGGLVVGTAEYGPIAGDRLVISAGAWACHYAETLGLPVPIHPIRGQICSFAVPPRMVRHMVFSSQAYWVGKDDGTLVCGASEDVAGYDTTVTERGINRLVRWGPRLFPFLEGQEPLRKWAGLRPATRDGWPLIGAMPERPDVIMAAGHYRNGILLSPATAALVGDLLQGKPALAAAPFAPDRFAYAAGTTGR